ncbi:MAG: pyridine nucleotide-disulfide oxidoreductase [Thermoprotei archaeon]|nr:MAG: pyridine nucleotide-disulfide oxidoreductase [Thermoprotei archaeon]
MKKADVVVIGGGPAGYTTALIASHLYPDKRIILVRREEKVLIPCAIPYLFSSIKSIDQNILPDKPLIDAGVEILVDEVKSVNTSNRIVKTTGGEELEYARLVLATGSHPVKLNLENDNLENVFYIVKRYEYIKSMVDAVREADKIVIVGGGFTGVEMADDIVKLGKDVTVVEALNHCLAKDFDPEFCSLAETELRKEGVKILTGNLVSRIEGNKKVEGVKLSNGTIIPADVVIISVGVRPNTDLAKAMGLRIGMLGGIETDWCRRTSDPLIFAVGDCAERPDFITGKPSLARLASVATNDARLAALNLFSVKAPYRPSFPVGAFITKIGDITLGCVGFTETKARSEKIDYIVGFAEAVNRHPSVLKGAKAIKLKILVSRFSREIIGAQVAGPSAVGEYLNLLSVLIQHKTKLEDLITLQIATHPWLTPSPVAYTLHRAALSIYKEL